MKIKLFRNKFLHQTGDDKTIVFYHNEHIYVKNEQVWFKT